MMAVVRWSSFRSSNKPSVGHATRSRDAGAFHGQADKNNQVCSPRTSFAPSAQSRLKRAFWVEGVNGAKRKAEEINRSQESYWSIVRRLPPLPDFVFAFKRFKRPRETLQPAGCSTNEQ